MCRHPSDKGPVSANPETHASLLLPGSIQPTTVALAEPCRPRASRVSLPCISSAPPHPLQRCCAYPRCVFELRMTGCLSQLLKYAATDRDCREALQSSL